MTHLALILWLVAAAIYLGLGILFYRVWREEMQVRPSRVHTLIAVILFPLAMLGCHLSLVIGLWPAFARWRKRIAPWRITNTLSEVRGRRHLWMDRARRAEHQLEHARAHAEAVDRRATEVAAGRAKAILNDHWLDATAAAREAMAKTFTDLVNAQAEEETR